MTIFSYEDTTIFRKLIKKTIFGLEEINRRHFYHILRQPEYNNIQEQ